MPPELGVTIKALAWLAILASSAAHAQADLAATMTPCDGKFGLCRYVDIATRAELIPARFERALPFSEGLAAVSLKGRFGYIDGRGEIVIEPKFDLAGNFHQGLAEVLIGDKTGVIDRTGEIVVPPMFQRAVPWTKNVIIAVEDTWGSGRFGALGNLPGLKGGDLYLDNVGFYHISGYWVLRPSLKSVRVFELDGRGLIWATRGNTSLGPFGLIASDGTWEVEPQYEYAAALSDGLAVVRKRNDRAVLSGAVDATGRLVIPLQPWALFGWRNGWGLARESYLSGKSALLDTRGNIIGGRFFDQVRRPDDGDGEIATVLIDGRWKGMDRAGSLLSHPRNGRVAASCPDGVRVVEVDGKIQITNAGGEPTASYLFEPLTQKPTCDRPFVVSLNGKWGFVGVDGRLLFDPPMFDNVHHFEGDYAFVAQGGKWGIIDTIGRTVVAPTYDGRFETRSGLTRVTAQARSFWITAAGEERPAPPIGYVRSSAPLNCGHGLRLVEDSGRWGIVDADGKNVIASRYRAVTCFRFGVAWAAFDDRRQWCAIGPDGTRRERPPCAEVHYPTYVTRATPQRFADDPFESSVL